jgi:hypothetical protein
MCQLLNSQLLETLESWAYPCLLLSLSQLPNFWEPALTLAFSEHNAGTPLGLLRMQQLSELQPQHPAPLCSWPQGQPGQGSLHVLLDKMWKHMQSLNVNLEPCGKTRTPWCASKWGNGRRGKTPIRRAALPRITFRCKPGSDYKAFDFKSQPMSAGKKTVTWVPDATEHRQPRTSCRMKAHSLAPGKCQKYPE